MLAFVDGVHPKNRTEIPLQQKEISIYEVANVPKIIREFFINYEMTTPKSCQDEKTPMGTLLYLSLFITNFALLTVFSDAMQLPPKGTFAFTSIIIFVGCHEIDICLLLRVPPTLASCCRG